jgi:hypothetical protein
MFGTSVVRATILVATVLWAWAEVLKIRRPAVVEPTRRVWTAAFGFALLHAVAAFQVAYGWSHAAALVDTARQTAAVTGLSWGGGIFANYLFLALWFADAVWWWVAPAAYLRRPLRVERTRLAIFLFMFLNGAVIFAGNAARAAGAPAVAAVCMTWLLDARRRSVAR